MRITSFPSVLVAAAAMWLLGCEPDESDMGPGTTINQNPGQAGYDAAVLPDAAAPGAIAGGTGGTGGTGGGFDAGVVNDGSVGPGRSDTGAGIGNGQEASVPDAAPNEAGPAGDASVPSEGGAGGYSPCPGGGMPCKILPLGDSITYGIDSSPSPSTGSYRVELFRKARAANQNITFVGDGMASGPTNVDGQPFPRDNEGHSGWRISGIADRVPTPALNDKPHITLLMIGTNDVSFGALGGIFGGGDLAGAPMRLGMLIDELVGSDPNMLVVVAKITPRSSGNSDTEVYNSALAAEVERRASQGKHVALVDMYKGFPQDGLSDSVHPNKKGYDWMAGVWYEAIKSVLR